MPGKLAAAVRAKYPGVYDDLDDSTLEASVRQKYPGVYDDMVGDDGPADGGYVPPMPGLPNPGRTQTRPSVPAFSEEQLKPTFAERAVEAGYQTGPTRLVEPDNIAGTAGAIAGAGAAMVPAIGPIAAIPTAAAVTGLTSKLVGGRKNYFERIDNEDQNSDIARDVAFEGLGGVAGLALPQVLKTGGRMAYRAGLKANMLPDAKVRELVETGVTEDIGLTRRGEGVVSGRIKGLNDAVAQTIDSLKNETVDLGIGLGNLRKLRAEKASNFATPEELGPLDRLIADYTERAGRVSNFANKAPTPLAQSIKVEGQSQLAKAYAADGVSPTVKEGRKAFVAGVREGIENTADKAGAGVTFDGTTTSLGKANARTAKLHDLEDAMHGRTAGMIQPGDVSSAGFLGPVYTAARMVLRPGPLGWVGRKAARLGDALDISSVPGRIANQEAQTVEDEARAATKAIFEQNNKPRGADLDALDIPVENRGEALTDFDRAYPIERLPEDGSVVDVLGQPARRPTPEDVAWERVMDQRRQVAEAEQRAATGHARDARLTREYGVQGEWDRKAQEPVQMMLGEPGAEFQMPLREAEAALPIRSTNPLERPAPQPADRFMSAPRAEPPPTSQGVKSVVMEEADNVPLAAPKAVNGTPAPEAQVFIVKAGQTPRPVPPGEAANVVLGPGERLAKRANGGAELTLVNQADVVGLSDGSGDEAARAFYAGKNADIEPGLRGVASRINSAEERFLEFAQGQGLSREDAVFALAEMRKGGKKAPLRVDAVGGQFTFAHGAFGEPDVLRRAAELGRAGKKSPKDVVGLSDGSNAGAADFYTNPDEFAWRAQGERYGVARETGQVAEGPGRSPFHERVEQRIAGKQQANEALRGQGIDPVDYHLNALRMRQQMRYLDTSGMGIELLDDAGLGVNASGESAASAEAISRLRGMQSRGEQFAVMTRDGRFRPLIGADAVDYVPRNGETFGILTQGPDGRPRFERR